MNHTPPGTHSAPAAPPRLIALRVYLKHWDRFTAETDPPQHVDVMAPHDATSDQVFGQALTQLIGRDGSLAGWEFVRIELGHERL